MEQPPSGPDPTAIQSQPPKLNTRQLWLTLLLPGLLTALGMLGMADAKGRSAETVFNVGCVIVSLAFVGCWVLFSKCISQRFIGTSRVLLILAYPVGQAIFVIAVFFAGCLLMVSKQGIH